MRLIVIITIQQKILILVQFSISAQFKKEKKKHSTDLENREIYSPIPTVVQCARNIEVLDN